FIKSTFLWSLSFFKTDLYHLTFLLSTADTSVPVVTVHRGEPVTLTCVLTEKFETVTWIHWYKQSAGNTLILIAMLRKSTSTMPTYGPGFSKSRFQITYIENMSELIISSTLEQDEGIYHCAYMDWTESTWTGTYLALKGKYSCFTVVQEPTVSDPTSDTDSETLQCSVLSDSVNATCSGEPSMFWFRAISDKSYPDFIIAEGKIPENCEKTSNNQKKCSYNFTKVVKSSEGAIYYCAVAACGQILFGNGTNLVKSNQGIVCIVLFVTIRIILVIILICLAISVTLNIIFICYRIQRSTLDLDLNYAALHFSERKEPRGTKKRELKTEESLYSQVKGQMSR
uniref:Ig-like domain-containing protein n=1 Tax=Poecilia reticulata TaxID=8081 RepID=A0A3P9PGY6_POERE